MRVTALLFSLFFILQAKEPTCYTVQITSAPLNQTNRTKLFQTEFPSSCKVMQIGKKLTVRCGCFETYDETKNQLQSLQTLFPPAYITSTYKYRFSDTSKKQKKAVFKAAEGLPYIAPKKKPTPRHIQHRSQAEEELKLMLQSFLYKNEVQDAYKVAKLGFKRYPKSLYWNKRVIDTARWSGHASEAIGYERALYKKNRNPKLRDNIINFALSAYQYEKIEDLTIQKMGSNPSDKNIDLMIFIQNKLGTPEKAAQILRELYKADPSKTELLTKELQIYLDMGDLDSAKKTVHIIESRSLFSPYNATLLAYYYYLNRDIKASYKALVNIDKDADKSDTKYFQLLSDLGWYMQKYEKAAKASRVLIQTDHARLIDYIRVTQAYKTSNPSLSTQSAKESFLKYKNNNYLFYYYAEGAKKLNRYDELRQIITQIDNSDSTLKSEAQYWIIKAQMYEYYHKRSKSIASLNKALSLEPSNADIQQSVFWFYLENSLNKELQRIMASMEEKNNLNSAFYLSFASAYYQLGDINKANFYIQKLIDIKSPLVHTIDFKFLKAYILQSRGEEESYIKTLKEILHDLQQQVIKDPQIEFTNTYWVQYLNAAINIVHADKFEKELVRAEDFLTPRDYAEISYSWATKTGAQDKSRSIFQKIQHKQLWMRFNDAMLFQEHTKIENILDRHVEEISQADAINAAKDDGQISLAQSLAYAMLNNNDFSKNAYRQFLELSKLRSSEFHSKVAFYNQNPLVQKYIKLDNRNYLRDSWNLYSSLYYFKNDSLNKPQLYNINPATTQFDLGLGKDFTKNSFKLHIGFKSALNDYLQYGIRFSLKPYSKIGLILDLEKNKETQDTTQLYIGAKKDMLHSELNVALLESTSFGLLYEKNYFSSQDNHAIGVGDYAKISVNKQYRNGYPDIGMSFYYDVGRYSENGSYQGLINKISRPAPKLLPNDFYNIGAEFRYGMANSALYTRAWRPYFAISPYYNSLSYDYNVGVTLGYGGKIWKQDHLVIGASYAQPANGFYDSIFEVFLQYNLLYSRP